MTGTFRSSNIGLKNYMLQAEEGVYFTYHINKERKFCGISIREAFNLKRKFDPGIRIIKYINYSKNFYAIIALFAGFAGMFGTFSFDPRLWPLMIFGFYAAVILFQYPGIYIYYTSRKFMLWWGPFFPLIRKKSDFSQIRQIQLEYRISQSPLPGFVLQMWHINILYSNNKYSFFNAMTNKEKAQELARSLASDLGTGSYTREYKDQKVIKKTKKGFFRKTG